MDWIIANKDWIAPIITIVLVGGVGGWWLLRWHQYEIERAQRVPNNPKSTNRAPAPWPDPEIEAKRAGMTVEEWLNDDPASREWYGRYLEDHPYLKNWFR